MEILDLAILFCKYCAVREYATGGSGEAVSVYKTLSVPRGPAMDNL